MIRSHLQGRLNDFLAQRPAMTLLASPGGVLRNLERPDGHARSTDAVLFPDRSAARPVAPNMGELPARILAQGLQIDGL